jgi:hypothetical protein
MQKESDYLCQTRVKFPYCGIKSFPSVFLSLLYCKIASITQQAETSVGRQIPITQILPEYLTCQAYLSTVSERLHKTGTYLTSFAQVPEWSI